MKKILCFLLFVVSMSAVNCQQIILETGKTISVFDYTTSSGGSLDNLTGTTHNLLGLGFRIPIKKTNLHFSSETFYNNYGAKGSDRVLNNYYEWDVNYVALDLGLDYEFFRPKALTFNQEAFSFYLKGAVAAEFLVQGTQRINNQVYDLAGEEQFDQPVYFYRAGAGVNYYLSSNIVVSIQYMGGKSFLIGQSDNQEKLKYMTHSISLCLSLSLIDFFK